MTRKTADEKGLKTIGDLSKLVPFKLGANPQFGELGYGIPGLKKVYNVGTNAKDVTFVPIEDFGGPDTVKALVDDSVQVADIYTTSPALVAEDLVVLEDPENMISSQNIIPLVAESAYSDQLAQTLMRSLLSSPRPTSSPYATAWRARRRLPPPTPPRSG